MPTNSLPDANFSQHDANFSVSDANLSAREHPSLPWVPVTSLPAADFSAHRTPAPGCPRPPALCRLEHVFDEILVLSLPRFAARASRMVAQLRALDAPFTLIHAYDSRSLNFTYKGLSGNTMALLTTVLAIADYVERSPFRHVLLFEDDATLAKDFPAAFDALARALPSNWRFLQLGQTIRLRGGDPACLPAGPLVLRTAATCIEEYWGVFSSAFSRDALGQLRLGMLRRKAPADSDKFDSLIRAFPQTSFFSWPPLVAMNPYFGSTLGNSWSASPVDWMRTNGIVASRFDLRGPGYVEGGDFRLPAALAPSQCLSPVAELRGVEVGSGKNVLWTHMKVSGGDSTDHAVSSRHQSEVACCVACTRSFPVCVAWTYHTQSRACSLKWSGDGPYVRNDGVVSGVVVQASSMSNSLPSGFATAQSLRGPAHALAPRSKSTCFSPIWPTSRAVDDEFSRKKAAHAVYHNVLVGACCAALTMGERGHAGAPPRLPPTCSSDLRAAGAPGNSTPGDSIVWVTHGGLDRVPLLGGLVRRWQGCVSFALHVCSWEAWEAARAAWEGDALLRDYVTVHVVVGALKDGAYPMNVMRNAAQETLVAGTAARAAWGATSTPWVVVMDLDGVPSASAAVFLRVLAVAATPGGVLGAPLGGGASGSSEDCSSASEPLPRLPPAPQTSAAPGELQEAAVDSDAASVIAPCHAGSNGFAWAASDAVNAAAARASRCPHTFDADRTFFVVPSFNLATSMWEKSNAEQLAAITRIVGPPVDSSGEDEEAVRAAVQAHAALSSAFQLKDAAVQAGYHPPSYMALLHIGAWLANDTGFIPVHYALGFEGYFVARGAALPLFDEALFGFGHNKQSLYTKLFARSDPWGLVMLPRLFILQQNSVPRSQIDTKLALPRTGWNKKRFSSMIRGLAVKGGNVACAGLCWCSGSMYTPSPRLCPLTSPGLGANSSGAPESPAALRGAARANRRSVLAPPPSLRPPHTFVHPGVLLNASDLAAVASRIASGAEPQFTAFAAASASPQGSLSYRPFGPPADGVVTCGRANDPSTGCTAETSDANAAYLHALFFALAGEPAHARLSLSIVRAWVSGVSAYEGAHAPLQAARSGAKWVRAAELLRHTACSGWGDGDTASFSNMIQWLYLPLIYQGSPSTGSWELSMLEAMMGFAVFLEDAALLNHAAKLWRQRTPAFFYSAEEDGPAHRPLPLGRGGDTTWHAQVVFNASTSGVCQETCGDFEQVSSPRRVAVAAPRATLPAFSRFLVSPPHLRYPPSPNRCNWG